MREKIQSTILMLMFSIEAKMKKFAIILSIILVSCDSGCEKPACTGEETYRVQSYQIEENGEPSLKDTLTTGHVQILIEHLRNDVDDFVPGYGTSSVCGGCIPRLVEISVDCNIIAGSDTLLQGVNILDADESLDRTYLYIAEASIKFLKPKMLRAGLRTFKMRMEFSEPERIVQGESIIYIPDDFGYAQ